MQKLAEVCIKRPIFAAMIVMALVVVGAASYFRLGVDRFPSVDLPTVRILTVLPGASPEEIETQVSQRIEEAVNTVEGINELRSISGQGRSLVIVTFNLERDIDTAAQAVRDRVATTLRDLPPGTDPPLISKFSNDLAPVMTIALSSPNRSIRELTELADKVVKTQLERSSGVGEVLIVGGLKRAINIWIDAERMAAYKIPITAVRNALVRQNADVPGGNVTAGAREQTLRTMGRITDPRAFNIGSGNFEIDYVIRGPELEQLSFYAEQLRSRSQELGIIDADTTLKLNKPELRVQIDRSRAADLGVDTDDSARALRLMEGGEENVSRFRDPSLNEDYDVQLRLREGQRNDPETILRLYVPRQGGGCCASTTWCG